MRHADDPTFLKGSAWMNAMNDANGSFNYTPARGFAGRDYFTWRVV